MTTTFVPSLMVIHQCILKLWWGHETLQTDRWTDWQTDEQTKCIPIIPSPLRGGGLKKTTRERYSTGYLYSSPMVKTWFQ